jgi:hypothetical protein
LLAGRPRPAVNGIVDANAFVIRGDPETFELKTECITRALVAIEQLNGGAERVFALPGRATMIPSVMVMVMMVVMTPVCRLVSSPASVLSMPISLAALMTLM